MKRRDVLRCAAASAIVAAAGCVTERSVPRAGEAGDGGDGGAGATGTTTDGGRATTEETTDRGEQDAAGETTDDGSGGTTDEGDDTRDRTDDERNDTSDETDDGGDDAPDEGDDGTSEDGGDDAGDGEDDTTDGGDDTGDRTDDGADGSGDGTDDGGNDTTGDGGADAGDDTDDGGSAPEVVGKRIETTDTGCLSGSAGGPTVRSGNGVVRIAGSVAASDPCHRAVLGNVGYDAGADVLTVDVGVVATDRTQPCVQCVGVVDYEAVIEFEGGLPGDVRVNEAGNAGGQGPDPA